MQRFGKEFLVGCLVLLALTLAVIFGWLLGIVNPLRSENRFYVYYSFAGGVELGSPVRVSGVKVGKVERIDFVRADEKLPVTANDQPAPTLRITLTVADRAAEAVREDSKFYVNMAGIIGERYVEVSPGSTGSKQLAARSHVRGIDPPRIDQLLSQGYGVFGKVQEFLDRNEKTMTDLVQSTEGIISELNKALKGGDKRRLLTLIENLNGLTADSRRMLLKLENQSSREFFERLQQIVERGSQVDKPALKKFLQEEGVRARIF